MNRDVLNHILDLDKLSVKKNEQGIILLNEKDIVSRSETSCVDTYNLGEIPVYAKNADGHTAFGMLLSRILNKLGYATPKTTLAKEETTGDIKSISQDVKNICQGIDHSAVRACDLREYLAAEDKVKRLTKGSAMSEYWAAIYDRHIQELFLSFLDQGCIDKLNERRIIGDLFTYTDPNHANIFLHKGKGCDKQTDPIQIDLERSGFVVTFSEDFDNFLDARYYSCEPFGAEALNNYRERILEIMELIQDGAFTPEQINLMKKIIACDITQVINEVEGVVKAATRSQAKSFGLGLQKTNIELQFNRTKEFLLRLLEYLNNTLGREL